MNVLSHRPTGFALLAALTIAGPVALSAQEQDQPEGEILTTVYGSLPDDMSELPDGPEIKGFISARNGRQVQVTADDGTKTVIAVGDGTEIRATKGLFGMGREKLAAELVAERSAGYGRDRAMGRGPDRTADQAAEQRFENRHHDPLRHAAGL